MNGPLEVKGNLKGQRSSYYSLHVLFPACIIVLYVVCTVVMLYVHHHTH